MKSTPHGSNGKESGKESACSAGDLGSIPGLGRSLEKEMTTHSSILAWRIPWTEEPGGLQVHGVTKSQPRMRNSFTFCTISIFSLLIL